MIPLEVGKFVQICNDKTNTLLGKIEDIDAPICRVEKIPTPTDVYINEQGIRTIVIPGNLQERKPDYILVHVDQLTLWDSSVLEAELQAVKSG